MCTFSFPIYAVNHTPNSLQRPWGINPIHKLPHHLSHHTPWTISSSKSHTYAVNTVLNLQTFHNQFSPQSIRDFLKILRKKYGEFNIHKAVQRELLHFLCLNTPLKKKKTAGGIKPSAWKWHTKEKQKASTTPASERNKLSAKQWSWNVQLVGLTGFFKNTLD